MAELPAKLKTYLADIVAKQQTGKFNPLMGYTPNRGMHLHLKAIEGDAHDTAAEGITRQDLRKLEGAKLISINTPRSTWAVKLRPAAFDA